jgi:hypothetical protein
MSSDVQNDTKVDEVVEIGTNGIVGGVAQLGEFKGKFSRYNTSSALLGLLTGKKLTGATQTWNYYDLANVKFNYCRLIADPLGAVFGYSLGLGAVLSDVEFSQKSTGIAMEDYSFMGPQLAYGNGFPVGKVRVVLSGDVSAGKLDITGTLGSGESPNPILPPAAGQPPNSLYTSGRCSFYSIQRVPAAQATINGVNYAAGSRVRYRENQPYKGVGAGLGVVGSNVITLTVLKADGTTMAYVGPELVVGSNFMVDAGGANQEICPITAVSPTTVTVTTTKTHATTGIGCGLAPTSGYVLYNPLTICFVPGDTLVSTDVWRYIFASYATTSTPTTIGTSSLDSTDVPGVPGRNVPVSIAAYGIPRCSDASMKITIARKQVQGLGEDEIAYGTAGVPKIDYSLGLMPTDNLLLQVLQTGSLTGGAGGDIFSADYMARYMLSNASPYLVNIKSPFNNTKTILSYQGNLPVFGSIAESGGSTSDMTMKLSGSDYSGAITITANA